MNTMLRISDFYEFANSLLEAGATYVSIEEVLEYYKTHGYK